MKKRDHRKEREKPREAAFDSGSHAHDEREIKQELGKVNRQLRQETPGHTNRIIWALMILLYISMIITTTGVLMNTGKTGDMPGTGLKENASMETTYATDATDAAMREHAEEITVTNETAMGAERKTADRDTADIEKKIAETPDDKRYRGVMLGSIVPTRSEYHTGENTVIETIIDLKGPERINLTAEYELTDPQGKNVYRYSERVEISQSNDILRKSILLTENYPEGEYTIGFRGWFETNGTRYVLPGKTKILVLERQKEGLAASLRPDNLSKMNLALLTMIIILNLLLLYNGWKTRYDNT